jgi:hypothetical protein
MARKKIAGRQGLRSLLSRSPELQQVSRQLASLSLAQMEQDGLLRVRQRELLRRALAAAGEARGWTGGAASNGDAIVEASKEVMTMARSGAEALAQDLSDELAMKRTETSRLSDAAASARKLAEGPEASYPAEITYSFTIRSASVGLITKTETITSNDAREALATAEAMEKSLPGRGRLAELMILDLERKQAQVEAMTRTLPDFVKSSRGLLLEVFATLH